MQILTISLSEVVNDKLDLVLAGFLLALKDCVSTVIAPRAELDAKQFHQQHDW